MTILGPLPCVNCGTSVRVDRIGAYLRVVVGTRNPVPHVCPQVRVPLLEQPDPNVCGAWMRNVEERCARRKGHAGSGGHRRRCVMDDDAAARRGTRVVN